MPVERMQTPEIDEELVAFLKLKYPNELPLEPEDPIETAIKIGQQRVVRFLAGKLASSSGSMPWLTGTPTEHNPKPRSPCKCVCLSSHRPHLSSPQYPPRRPPPPCSASPPSCPRLSLPPSPGQGRGPLVPPASTFQA